MRVPQIPTSPTVLNLDAGAAGLAARDGSTRCRATIGQPVGRPLSSYYRLLGPLSLCLFGRVFGHLGLKGPLIRATEHAHEGVGRTVSYLHLRVRCGLSLRIAKGVADMF